MTHAGHGVLHEVRTLGAVLLLMPATGRLRAFGVSFKAAPKVAEIIAAHPVALRQALLELARVRE